MTESEWLTSTDPVAMLEDILPTRSGDVPPIVCDGGRQVASNRKLRLFACAHIEETRGRKWYNLQQFYAAAEKGEVPDMATRFRPTAPGKQAALWAAENRETDGKMTQDRKAALLRDLLGNPFALDRLQKKWREELWQRWLTPTVLAVASTIYEERCWGRMGELADALEEAGCTDAEMVNHCRGLAWCWGCKGTGKRNCQVDAGYNNPLMTRSGWQHCSCTNYGKDTAHPGWFKPRVPLIHCRGCWVVDLVLGKS